MRKLLHRLPVWTVSGVILAAILWLTLAPRPLGDEEVPMFEGADKIVHLLMFGTLAAALIYDTARHRDKLPNRVAQSNRGKLPNRVAQSNLGKLRNRVAQSNKTEILNHAGRVLHVPLWLVAVIAVATCLFGAGIEWAQYAMGLGRSFEVADIIADSAGALYAAFLYEMYSNE